jgi:serine/threonine protein kinase
MNGCDIAYHLDRAPESRFSEEQVKFYMTNMVLALEYVHGAGVMHRDLKVCPNVTIVFLFFFIALAVTLGTDRTSREKTKKPCFFQPEKKKTKKKTKKKN